MSLFNQIAESLSNRSLANAVGDGVNAGLGGVTQAFGGSQFGSAVGNIGVSMARNAAVGLVNKYIPPSAQRLANAGTGAVGDILRGDFDRAGLRLLDSGLLREFLPGMDGVAAQARFFGTPTPLMGGISPAEAKGIYEEMRGQKLCRKNLWLIEVDSPLLGDFSGRFNLFATELEYSPHTITGEKRKIGAAHADIVNSSDPVELRMTTMDDEDGFVKTWFAAHCQAAANRNGTVGVPAQYAIRIKVVHGFIRPGRGYEDLGYFRPANIDISLSRREDGLQELALSFVQLDTFVQVI
jgi:hypothetical protein